MKGEIGVIFYKPRNTKDGQQPPEAEERHGTDFFSLELSEENSPANTLILDSQVPELGDNTFLLSNLSNPWHSATAALGSQHNNPQREALLLPFLGNVCLEILTVLSKNHC